MKLYADLPGRRTLQILADLYLAQGKSDKAIYVYQELMKTAPTDKNVCLWQYNISHAMLSMPNQLTLLRSTQSVIDIQWSPFHR